MVLAQNSITLAQVNDGAKGDGLEVVIGTQTAATGSWTGVAGFSELKDGQQITYWLPYAGSGNATLNLTLSNGTTTGAIPCYYNGTSRLTTHYGAGNAVRLLYRENVKIGSTTIAKGWWADANYDSNTYDRIRLNNSITAKAAISASRLIVGDDSGFFHLAANTAFDITKPILYAGSAISSGATGSNNYLSYPSVTLRNNLSGVTLTKNKTCYLVGTLNGKTFTPNSTMFTTTIPITDDGLVYISLGLMISTYQIYLYPEHPMFQYKDGAFKSVAQVAVDAKLAADNAQADIDNLEIGGRNMIIRKTEVPNTWLDSTGAQVTQSGHSSSDFIAIEPGQIYSFSRIFNEGTYWRNNWYDADKNFIARAPYNVGNFQWTAPANAYFIRCSYPTDSQPKMEKGNKYTDWSPAPEDMTTSEESDAIKETIGQQYADITKAYNEAIIEAKQTLVTTDEFGSYKETQESELKTKFDGITGRVSQTEEDIQKVGEDLQAKYETITSWFTFDINGLTIGKTEDGVESPFKVVIDNDDFVMYANGVPVLTLDPKGFSKIPDVKITERLELLGFVIEKDTNGNVNCGKIGG